MMDKLTWQLKDLLHHNRDGGRATQKSRQETLMLVAKQLKALGFKFMNINGLKAKHVTKLTEKWKADGLANGTIKNRMAHIRWWARKTNAAHKIPSNDQLEIEHRNYVTNDSKAVILTQEHLKQVADPNIKISLQLQAYFGLRREEAIKFNAQYADQGDRIILKDTWCKGKRSREIPITTQEQRNLIDQIKREYGHPSYIKKVVYTFPIKRLVAIRKLRRGVQALACANPDAVRRGRCWSPRLTTSDN
jgi:site-specific recombinase XerC